MSETCQPSANCESRVIESEVKPKKPTKQGQTDIQEKSELIDDLQKLKSAPVKSRKSKASQGQQKTDQSKAKDISKQRPSVQDVMDAKMTKSRKSKANQEEKAFENLKKDENEKLPDQVKEGHTETAKEKKDPDMSKVKTRSKRSTQKQLQEDQKQPVGMKSAFKAKSKAAQSSKKVTIQTSVQNSNDEIENKKSIAKDNSVKDLKSKGKSVKKRESDVPIDRIADQVASKSKKSLEIKSKSVKKINTSSTEVENKSKEKSSKASIPSVKTSKKTAQKTTQKTGGKKRKIEE